MTAQAAYWFLPAVIPIAFYISWSDMRFMKITNNALLVLLAAFALLGPFAFGFEMYLWQWLNFAVVLAVCMALWALRTMGGGDAKMLAVMAPFFVVDDLRLIMQIFVACTLGAVVIHSIFRFTPLRNLAPDWKSWSATSDTLKGITKGRKMTFPKGVPLSMTLLFYLIYAVVYR